MLLGYVAPSRRSVDVAASAVATGRNTGMYVTASSSSAQPLWNASCLLLTRYICSVLYQFITFIPPNLYVCIFALVYALLFLEPFYVLPLSIGTVHKCSTLFLTHSVERICLVGNHPFHSVGVNFLDPVVSIYFLSSGIWCDHVLWFACISEWDLPG
jgi:hypothetical protein